MDERDARLSDEEWRAFQQIPDQGYSHRRWLDALIAERTQAARAEGGIAALEEAADRILNWRFEEPDRADVLEQLLRLGNDLRARAAALRAQGAEGAGDGEVGDRG